MTYFLQYFLFVDLEKRLRSVPVIYVLKSVSDFRNNSNSPTMQPLSCLHCAVIFCLLALTVIKIECICYSQRILYYNSTYFEDNRFIHFLINFSSSRACFMLTFHSPSLSLSLQWILFILSIGILLRSQFLKQVLIGNLHLHGPISLGLATPNPLD